MYFILAHTIQAKKSYLKVTTLSEGFAQTLQLRFGTSKTIQNWASMVVYFTVIAKADNQLWMTKSEM